MKRTYYVVAWEYVNPGPEAGGGGFDWFYQETPALAAYAADLAKMQDHPDHAIFYFEFASDELPGAQLTEVIDGQLFDLCARATTRHVGANVLAYWRQHGMKMEAA